jgi:hypothetical protein
MPKYLVLIYGDERRWAEASDEWNEANGERHRAFTELAGKAVLAGAELEPSATAVSLRGSDDGRFISSDGPFVEAKEGIGGYYVLEAPDLAAAVELASHVPEATTPSSGVEVRALRT